VRGDDDRQRAPDAGQLLDGDGIGQRVQAGTTLLFGKWDAEQPHLAQLGDDVGRKSAILLVLVDLGLDLTGKEIADRSAEQFVLR